VTVSGAPLAGVEAGISAEAIDPKIVNRINPARMDFFMVDSSLKVMKPTYPSGMNEI
jgi:hypothetical protein